VLAGLVFEPALVGAGEHFGELHPCAGCSVGRDVARDPFRNLTLAWRVGASPEPGESSTGFGLDC
jgi:hypothetical protein